MAAAHQLKVPMRIREDGREERSAPVLVAVQIEADAQSSTPRNLMCFQLTDESDPFFLYTLRISEEEFQTVKVDQSILVDFAEFPARFLELLRHCLPRDDAETPKFAVSLVAGSSATSLQIVETNQFKNLMHLRLDMRAGNDAAVKRYLAGELAKTKSARDDLQERLDAHMDATQQASVTATACLAAAKRSEEAALQELNELKLEHASACASLREQAVQLQQSLQFQNDADKTELARNHRVKEEHMNTQIDELRLRLDAMTAEKTRFQTEARELQTRAAALDQELASCRQELSDVRSENKDLDRCKHENLKTIQAHEVRMSTLQQQVVDGEAMNVQLNKLVESAHAQKNSQEDNVRMLRDSNAKLEDKVRLTSAEVAKANEYIERLQNEIKTLKTKLKVKMAVVMQQEQVVQDKDKTIAQKELKITAAEQAVNERDGQIEILKSKLSQAESRLAEAERTMESNQQVISWLNKEVNEAQMSTRGAFSAASFRPTVPANARIGGVESRLALSSGPNPEALLASARMSSKGGSHASLTSSAVPPRSLRPSASPFGPTGDERFSPASLPSGLMGSSASHTSAHTTGTYSFDSMGAGNAEVTGGGRQVEYRPSGLRHS
eukprot:Tamp_08617.p1 GENE.Tamp_08617~~Tamp_08617.p1  ORF type:complete len:613 (+),score=164.28 Tamp_08617:132-1970(+)